MGAPEEAAAKLVRDEWHRRTMAVKVSGFDCESETMSKRYVVSWWMRWGEVVTAIEDEWSNHTNVKITIEGYIDDIRRGACDDLDD